MKNKLIVSLKNAVTGVLHGEAGTFRILIDEEISGAKNFSLLVNTSKAGTKGEEHKHTVEHCWYILSGKGTVYLNGKSFSIEPEMAIYVPANTLHKLDVEPDEDITYVVIYAPPGPEKLLKQKGANAFKS